MPQPPAAAKALCISDRKGKTFSLYISKFPHLGVIKMGDPFKLRKLNETTTFFNNKIFFHDDDEEEEEVGNFFLAFGDAL